MHRLEIAIAYIIFFLIGGIPFGLIVAKLKKVDLSKIGSGSIGATNVYRGLGMKYAVLVFLLDGLKGAFCAIAGLELFGPGYAAGFSGVAAMFGHIFSPYLKFRGGKGVATGFGVMLVFAVRPSVIVFGIWMVIVALGRIVSIGSLAAALALPALVYAFDKTGWVFYTSLLVIALVILSHRENILRLVRGQEKPAAREANDKQ